MHNITGFLLVFESSKTVQYSRRHLHSKFTQKQIQISAVQRLFTDLFSGEVHHRHRPSQHGTLVPFDSKHRGLQLLCWYISKMMHRCDAIVDQSWLQKQILFQFSFAVSTTQLQRASPVVSVRRFHPSRSLSTDGTSLLLNLSSFTL
jgi:hypothetical protein